MNNDNNNLWENVTDNIINEDFPNKDMQIEHLKEVSDVLKTNPEVRKEIQDLMNSNNVKTVDEGVTKTKSLFLNYITNKKFNGFASILVLCLTTLFFSGGSLLYILLTNGFFN